MMEADARMSAALRSENYAYVPVCLQLWMLMLLPVCEKS